MSEETVKICANHGNQGTPLIFTCAFPGAEYWCPHCGYTSGMFGAGRNVSLTPELSKRALDDETASLPYLRAVGAQTAYQVRHNNEWVKPENLPPEVKAENERIISEWKYNEGGEA